MAYECDGLGWRRVVNDGSKFTEGWCELKWSPADIGGAGTVPSTVRDIGAPMCLMVSAGNNDFARSAESTAGHRPVAPAAKALVPTFPDPMCGDVFSIRWRLLGGEKDI